MKISHVSNSFIKITSADFSLVCDPWAGVANHGGWRSFPEYSLDSLLDFTRDCDYVYISHIHSDHFDEDLLGALKLADRTFVIKKFANGVLKRRLVNLGVKAIVELEPFDALTLGAMSSFTIIPQYSSNQSGYDDQINFDLDTSIVISDGEFTFFNQVDNPLSIDSYIEIKKFIADAYGEVDVACFAVGAAGEYPQCFKGIDRQAEQERVVEASLAALQRKIEILKPRTVFPAGGTYFVPGRFSALNKYIAQPSFEQISNRISTRTQPVRLEGGVELEVKSRATVRVVTPINGDMSASIKSHRGDDYAYHKFDKAFDEAEIANLSNISERKYEDILQEKSIDVNFVINFYLYNHFNFDNHLNITAEKVFSYWLGLETASYKIDVHMDWRAYVMCLSRRLIWNQVLSGSLCLFERHPNVHRPEVLFSLNYFAA